MFVRLKFGAAKGGTAAVAEAPSDTTKNPPAETQKPATPRASAPAASDKQRRSPRIKTYEVAEVRQAMFAARRELGEDAILIQTKRVDPPRAGIKYEVTFGIAGEEHPDESTVALVASANSQGREAESRSAEIRAANEIRTVAEITVRDSSDAQLIETHSNDAGANGVHSGELRASESRSNDPRWTSEFERLRSDIAALQAMVSRQYWDPNMAATSGRRAVRLRNVLVEQGVDADLASDWIMAIEDGMKTGAIPATDDVPARLLETHLSSRIRVDDSLGWDASQGKAHLLVGPPGSGKTTAMLKLALEYGIKRGRSVELWSLDAHASEPTAPVKSFAHLLSIPCRAFLSAKMMATALSQANTGNRLVLIDSSGFGYESTDTDRELSMVTGGPAAIDCQLVLPATWHPAALRRIVDRYEIFQPSRLLFTMLDQACTFGSLLQEPWRTGKPLSFLSEGAIGSGSAVPANLRGILDRIDQAAG